MIEEAIEAISRMALDAQPVKVIALPGNPRQVLLDKGSAYSVSSVPPPLRNHALERIEDLCGYAVRTTQVGDPSAGGPSFWHSDRQIVVLLDDGERREFLRLCLGHSPQWLSLEGLLGRNGLRQDQLIRLLRFDLDGCLDDPAIVSIFRQIKFRSSQASAGEIQHGRESLGREVLGDVTGAGALPEEIRVTIPVYKNPDLDQYTCPIRLALEIDFEKQQFLLAPFPDELPNAQQFLHDSIREMLTKLLPEGTPIIQGTP
jgi:hypothetical protein